MGFKSRARKRLEEADNQHHNLSVVIREPSPKRNNLFSEVLGMTRMARKGDGRFRPFNERPTNFDTPLNENNHALLVSNSKGEFLGYLTYCTYENINWPIPSRIPKLIDEFMNAWIEIQWSVVYDEFERGNFVNKRWCMLNQVWIKKKMRRKGIGSLLIKEFLDHCSSHDLVPVVDDPNSNFRISTKKMGYIEGKDWVHHNTNLVIPKKLLWDGAERGLLPTSGFLKSKKQAIEWQYNDGNARLPEGIIADPPAGLKNIPPR